MPFRITAKGITIEVDTEAELKSVLNVLGKISLSLTEDENIAASADFHNRVLTFYRNLDKGHMASALSALINTKDGLTDIELRELLELETNNKLAGVLTGIIRNAKKAGIYVDNMIIKQKLERDDNTITKYRLSDSFRNVISEAKIQQKEKSAQGFFFGTNLGT